MQHHPERLYDAINANELGAIITEHRNLLLCSLLRPMLDTFEQEGIQLSAVLRALATLSQERSSGAAGDADPWLQCEALLQQAQASAAQAEQRSKGTEGNRERVGMPSSVERITANLNLPQTDRGEMGAESMQTEGRNGTVTLSYDDLPECVGSSNGTGNGLEESVASAIAQHSTDPSSMDWSQVSDEEAWAKELLEDS